MNLLRWAFFELRYLLSRPPWDTGVSPPELLAYLDSHPPGRALDVGCGTGTNAVAMAARGWQVTGVDFSFGATPRARRRARQAGLKVDFRRGNAADLDLQPASFDLVVDIGCLHSLDPQRRTPYSTALARWLRPGGTFLLYAFLRPPGGIKAPGLTQAEVEALLSGFFHVVSVVHGTDRDRPSAWFTLQRAD